MVFIFTNILGTLNCETMRALDVCPFLLGKLKPGTILASLKKEARYNGLAEVPQGHQSRH